MDTYLLLRYGESCIQSGNEISKNLPDRDFNLFMEDRGLRKTEGKKEGKKKNRET